MEISTVHLKAGKFGFLSQEGAVQSRILPVFLKRVRLTRTIHNKKKGVGNVSMFTIEMENSRMILNTLSPSPLPRSTLSWIRGTQRFIATNSLRAQTCVFVTIQGQDRITAEFVVCVRFFLSSFLPTCSCYFCFVHVVFLFGSVECGKDASGVNEFCEF